MPYCKYCSSAIDADSVFCSSCGKQLKKKTERSHEEERTYVETEVAVSEDRDLLIHELLCALNDAELNELQACMASYNLAISLYESLLPTAQRSSDEEDILSAEAALAKNMGFPKTASFAFEPSN